MIISEIEFPDTCPINCPDKGKEFTQSGLCIRCPIFNCKPFPYKNEDGSESMISLIEPEEYRKDWAIEWKKWFDSNCEGFPKLLLFTKKENDDDDQEKGGIR